MRHIIFIFAAIACLTSCELHTSNNGDLDNWWYLRQVDSLDVDKQVDYKDKRVFWGFIDHLMQTERIGGTMYIYRYDKTDATLRVYQPHINKNTLGDTLLWEKDLVNLKPHGLNMKPTSDGKTFEETFIIEQLNSEKMVLLNESHTLRLHFQAW